MALNVGKSLSSAANKRVTAHTTLVASTDALHKLVSHKLPGAGLICTTRNGKEVWTLMVGCLTMERVLDPATIVGSKMNAYYLRISLVEDMIESAKIIGVKCLLDGKLPDDEELGRICEEKGITATIDLSKKAEFKREVDI